jgi:peptidoglycan hydrolase CwlO-like protein
MNARAAADKLQNLSPLQQLAGALAIALLTFLSGGMVGSRVGDSSPQGYEALAQTLETLKQQTAAIPALTQGLTDMKAELRETRANWERLNAQYAALRTQTEALQRDIDRCNQLIDGRPRS